MTLNKPSLATVRETMTSPVASDVAAMTISFTTTVRRLTRTTKTKHPYVPVAIGVVGATVLASQSSRTAHPHSRLMTAPTPDGELKVYVLPGHDSTPRVQLVDGTYRVVVGSSYVFSSKTRQVQVYKAALRKDFTNIGLSFGFIAADLATRQVLRHLVVGDRDKLTAKRAVTFSAIDIARYLFLRHGRSRVARVLRDRNSA